MKELEGKEVYLRPTGNNARRGSKRFEKALIVKVARVFVTFKIEGHHWETKYRFDGRNLESGHNSGYVVYANRQELEDYYETQELASKISEKYRYQRDYMQVELSKLRQVAEVLDV